MSETTVRETFKEQLRPTPEQERALDETLWRCRILYNTALEQRITAWQRCRLSLSRYEQEAELKGIRAELPEYAAIHSHVLQDVLARLDKTYQAFFRRVQKGEKAGFPRFKGPNRYHSFTYKDYGHGARLDNGYLVLSKIGRISVPGYPERHGGMRRSLSGRGESCVHQPEALWLWCGGPHRRIRALAFVPSVWNRPASGP
jgi:putative transposase